MWPTRLVLSGDPPLFHSTSGGGGKGGSECSSLTRVEGSVDRQGSGTRSPAGGRSGLDVRSSGHPDPGVQSGESGRGEGLLGSDRHRVERSRSPGSREDLADPSLVESVTSRSTGDRTSTGPVHGSGRPVWGSGQVDWCRPVFSSSGPVFRIRSEWGRSKG